MSDYFIQGESGSGETNQDSQTVKAPYGPEEMEPAHTEVIESNEKDGRNNFETDRAPTQCAEDVISIRYDQDLHENLHSIFHSSGFQTDPVELSIKVCFQHEGPDLSMKAEEDVEVKYVEEMELGVSCKNENAKVSASKAESNGECVLPLDIQKYLKDPSRKWQSFHTVQVYMLHDHQPHQHSMQVHSSKAKIEQGKMSEIVRLGSFAEFPPGVAVYTSRLASSGFIYLPEKNSVACCFCDLEVDPRSFIGVLPDELHKRRSPNCPRVENVVISSPPVPDARLAVDSGLESNGRDSTAAYQSSVAFISPSPVVQGGSHTSTFAAGEEQADSRAIISVPTDSASSFGSTPSAQDSRSSVDSQPYAVTDSARSADATRQAEQSAAQPSSPKKTTDAPKEKKKLTYADLGIFAEKPKRPEMAVLQKRVQSFNGKWKQHYTQTPAMLADAGMYYAGYGDCARCFFCGGGLKNWEPPDSPWIEHARWFPKCGFVRMSKGQAFVDIVQRKNRDKQEITLKEVEEELTKKWNEKAAAIAENVPESTGVPTSDAAANLTGKNLHGGASTTLNQQVPDLEKLEQENEELRGEIMCKICMDEESSVVFLPCGHLVSCTHCAHALRHCPLCRAEIKGSVRAHMG